ncbi:hypothetical protein MuYL_4837 [Mucilaginibacter xinganensis]|uniref:Uncharacterized protein n=1 Tax=Mucilaginibacter xinganensis TaxID=1234841 RepID=A0A223P3V9_9SPHI|nr:hypothetical protein MuYL_4837 [Mucilaginibacter xinganensis]
MQIYNFKVTVQFVSNILIKLIFRVKKKLLIVFFLQKA